MANLGEWVTYVACTEDKVTVDLADGRSILVPLAWYQVFCTPPLRSALIGRLLGLAMESIGQILMRT
jgi:hypothetical protein